MLLLVGLTDYVGDLFTQYHYLAPFTILFLCGLGFPLPEEVALIGAGLLVYEREVHFVPMVLVCSSAILLGDSIPYWLGRHYGLAALKTRWVAKVVHPERFATLERRFAEHGNWAIFTCRFLPGLRIPGYFVAGTMRMSFTRFLLIDLLGVLISVPASIWLGKLFGGTVEDLHKTVHKLDLWLAFAVVTLVLIMFVGKKWRKRERRGGSDRELP